MARVRGTLPDASPIGDLRAIPLNVSGTRGVIAASRRRVIATLGTVSRGKFGTEHYEELVASAKVTIAVPSAETAQRVHLGQLTGLIVTYEVQAEELPNVMADLAAPLPEAQALATISRMNLRTAGAFLGAVGDVHSYESVDQVLRLAGLNLITRESGVQKGVNRISKRGRSELRRQLYLLSLSTVQRGGVYRREYAALCARNGGKKKKALVAISRHLLRLMFSMARSGKVFDPERRHGVAPGPHCEEDPPPTRA